MENILDLFTKLSIPLGVLTAVIGGSAWLTTTHDKVETIEKDLSSFTTMWQEQKERLASQVNAQDSRLSRMEGKLDLLLENIKSWRDRHGKGSNSDSDR